MSSMQTALAVVAMLVAGAIGLFLALPGGRQAPGRAGWVALAAAGGMLVALLAHFAGGAEARGAFVVCVLVALFGALRVITHAKPVYSALYFVLVILAVTGLMVLMEATFVAAILVIVYAGAILVTYVFVIMMAQQARPAPYDARAREPLWGVLAGFALLTILAVQVLSTAPRASPAAEMAGPIATTAATAALDAAAAGTVEHVGTPLLTHYVIGVQIVGVLLLAALVGAIAIARRKPVPASLEEAG